MVWLLLSFVLFAHVGDAAGTCRNLADKIDRSAHGQCPSLLSTLSRGASIDSTKYAWPVIRGDGDWHNELNVQVPKVGSTSVSRLQTSVMSVRKFTVAKDGLPFPTGRISYFSFVRDPLERFVSAYYELHHTESYGCILHSKLCWASVGAAPTDRNATVADILKRVGALVSYFEAAGFFNAHLRLQVSFYQLPGPTVPPKGEWPLRQATTLPVENMWDLSCIDEALLAINLTHTMGNNTATRQSARVHHGRAERLRALPRLNTSVLPTQLAQRICQMYTSDYCCLGIPVNPQCGDDFALNCSLGSGPCSVGMYTPSNGCVPKGGIA
jgi:hypothetical protein